MIRVKATPMSADVDINCTYIAESTDDIPGGVVGEAVTEANRKALARGFDLLDSSYSVVVEFIPSNDGEEN